MLLNHYKELIDLYSKANLPKGDIDDLEDADYTIFLKDHPDKNLSNVTNEDIIGHGLEGDIEVGLLYENPYNRRSFFLVEEFNKNSILVSLRDVNEIPV